MTKHAAWLNGVGLSSLDNTIVVQAVEEQEPTINTTAMARWGGGQWLTAQQRQALDVSIVFAVRQRNMELRARILDSVLAWARGGGWLEVTHRPGKRLRVTCVQLPAMGDARKWSESYTILLRAYEVPYWQDIAPLTTTAEIGADTEAEVSAAVQGNTTAPMDAIITNNGTAACTRIQLRTRDGIFAMEQLGLLPGETLHIGHDERGLLRLTISDADGGERSVYGKRTVESMDDLMIHRDWNRVHVTSDAPVLLKIKVRGRWL